MEQNNLSFSQYVGGNIWRKRTTFSEKSEGNKIILLLNEHKSGQTLTFFCIGKCNSKYNFFKKNSPKNFILSQIIFRVKATTSSN